MAGGGVDLAACALVTGHVAAVLSLDENDERHQTLQQSSCHSRRTLCPCPCEGTTKGRL